MGLEIEFDVPELNQIMGFDAVDWRQEYIGRNVPVSVIDKIANDAKNIQSVETQIAVLWELCEEFGFAKHKKGAGSMLDKFMRGTKEKYDKIDTENRGVSKALKMLREKYEIDISWTENTMRTIERFDL